VTADATRWPRTEPEAMLSKAIARSKRPPDSVPAIALSYSIYEDGAYLAWAIARFWGVSNWFSTLSAALPVTPSDAPGDAELIGRYNRWEQEHSDLNPGDGNDVVEVRVVFNRAARDRGWRDVAGADHWGRIARWSKALLEHDIGYRFITSRELADAHAMAVEHSPIVLDGCVLLNDEQCTAIDRFLAAGGTAWVVPPLDAAAVATNALVISPDIGSAALPELIAANKLLPRIRRLSGPTNWRVRLRVHKDNLVAHLLNAELVGIDHPHVTDRWLRSNVLHRIEGQRASEPLVLELDLRGLPSWQGKSLALRSPEMQTAPSVRCVDAGNGHVRLEIPINSLLVCGVISRW
jgi:hypothetical protein